MPELHQRFDVEHLYLFGSVARGEEKPGSDVDLLVEFVEDSRLGLFGFVQLRDRLAEILGRPVDLVSRAALKPAIRDRIQRELVLAA